MRKTEADFIPKVGELWKLNDHRPGWPEVTVYLRESLDQSIQRVADKMQIDDVFLVLDVGNSDRYFDYIKILIGEQVRYVQYYDEELWQHLFSKASR